MTSFKMLKNIRSKLQFVSLTWNCVTQNDSSKNEKVQRKLANLWYNKFFINLRTKILARLNLSVLCSRRWQLDFLFLIKVSFNKISCPSILNDGSLWVPSKIIRGHCSFCTNASPLPDLLQRLKLSVVKSIFSTTMEILWNTYFCLILIDSLNIAHLLSFPRLIPSFVAYFLPSLISLYPLNGQVSPFKLVFCSFCILYCTASRVCF